MCLRIALVFVGWVCVSTCDYCFALQESKQWSRYAVQKTQMLQNCPGLLSELGTSSGQFRNISVGLVKTRMLRNCPGSPSEQGTSSGQFCNISVGAHPVARGQMIVHLTCLLL